MFYCEQCRIANEWPTGIFKSRGPCEICGNVRDCYDRPSSSLPAHNEVRKVSLMPLEGERLDEFKIEDLLAPQHYRAIRVISQSPRRVVVEFGKGDLANPDTDPLIMGTVLTAGGNYSVRVLWDNKLWRPWDAETDQFMSMMEGVKVFKRFKKS